MIQCYPSGFSSSDVNQAVQIQLKEIDQGFLSSLGDKPLRLIFHHIADSRYGIMVMAKDKVSNRVVGYALGTLSSGKLYKDFILKKLPYALIYFLPKLLSFHRMKKAFETLLYPAKQQSNLPTAELLDLAVESTHQGTGVAEDLFRHLEKEFTKRDIRTFQIPTGASLKRAHKFYEKMGAKKSSSFQLHSGEETLVYVYERAS
ncbi:GNAT family N-acetyltransferase [Desulfovermiculus halophilus]|uniref:GNAT family N-acetyltransferase n=1 Tax=Desulfovermiculus halophilus TaxID=339722 RepID=UPI0004827673|nr:GNAT family N-acetyltransferase [Desulfovermiculus halophilus]